MILDEITWILASTPFIARGGFHPEDGDGVLGVVDGGEVATVIMIGNAGGALWEAFAAAVPEPAGRDPLDDWTKTVLAPVAARFGAHPVYPSDGPPYMPFQRWAMRAEPVSPSPLGVLIHSEYGLWHAYRAAFLFPEKLALRPLAAAASPCESCTARPCLSTCPVGAFSEAGYEVPACAAHVHAPEGQRCRDSGCLARAACPVGPDWRYPAATGAFHLAAFARNHVG
ncbi:MAG: ferredoxin [Proteobacteria bacterium]|nr:ferredoxin [Pseudomonadota bacterium]